MLDHATSEIAIGSKLGVDATKKLPGEGFKRPRPPCGAKALGERRLTLIKMDAAARAKVENFSANGRAEYGLLQGQIYEFAVASVSD